MARTKSRNKVVKVQPTLSAQQLGYLEQLVEIGNFGNTPTEVARYLIQHGIGHFIDTGVITIKNSKAKAD